MVLAPHRAYQPDIKALWDSGVCIKAMAHITGGGFLDNIPRVLPEGLGVEIDRSAWEVPAIFHLIQERGGVSDREMYHVFNMGIGLVVMVGQEQAQQALGAVPEAAMIGRVIPLEGSGSQVRLWRGDRASL
jgi:phosphoribosylformylglycinamidine cyclo-ligase